MPEYGKRPIAQLRGNRFAHIPTNELALLLRYARSTGFGEAPHALAYAAELSRRAPRTLTSDLTEDR